MKESDDKMMMSDKNVQMAGEKMMADSSAVQMLFQQLVARHIAAKKMTMVMKADSKMESMAGEAMKKMDPKMAPMMADDKVKMAGEMMMKDTAAMEVR